MYLDDKQQSPICNRGMCMLNSKRNEPTKRTRNSGEPKPIGHAQTHFRLRVPIS